MTAEYIKYLTFAKEIALEADQILTAIMVQAIREIEPLLPWQIRILIHI